MTIKALDIEFTVCKVEDWSEVNLASEFVFIGKTDEENSLVCQKQDVPKNATAIEHGWRAMRICGALDFSLIGILAKICGLLADNGIGIFAISTYNTDYILTKSENFEKALNILEKSGYEIFK